MARASPADRQQVKFVTVQAWWAWRSTLLITWVGTAIARFSGAGCRFMPMPLRWRRFSPSFSIAGWYSPEMDRIVYERMAAHDTTHWWYRARREILCRLSDALCGDLPKDARILEIGCGTGHNLPMLAQFGEIDAIEIDETAGARPASGWASRSARRRCPSSTGVEPGSYDLVAVLDVIEHVEDDVAALKAIASALKPGGKILITVPAHQWMWSAHDVVNHHKRRYSKGTLTAALEKAGLEARKLRWFNSLLFPAAVAARLAGRLMGKDDSDDSPPPRPLNADVPGHIPAGAAPGRPGADAAGAVDHRAGVGKLK
jgi:SAM-dependent methyltransferase